MGSKIGKHLRGFPWVSVRPSVRPSLYDPRVVLINCGSYRDLLRLSSVCVICYSALGSIWERDRTINISMGICISGKTFNWRLQ